MAPVRRKARRNAGAAAIVGKKKLPQQGRGGQQRDLSSRSSSSRSRSGSYSGTGSDEDSSSDASDSDEDHPDDYKKGGYHPVMPYQLYNGRFRVLSKLGAGAFSTVWLCADEKDSSSSLVAVKVCKSKKSVTEQAEDEVALLDRLQDTENSCPHTVQMRNHFWHSGPNGRHKCMVFEVMGENLLALVKYHDYHGLPINIVRRLARHTLLGLEYIHSRGVIHTDVKLENVLVQRHDLADLIREAHKAHRIFTEQKQGGEGLTKSQKKRMKQKQKKNADVADAKVTQAEEAAEPVEAEGQPLSKSQKKKANKKKQKNGEAKGEAADGGGDSEIEEPATAVVAKDNKANDGDDNESDDDRAAAEACGRPVPPVRQKERFKTFGASQVFAKLADFGNGCRVDRKVTDDIQTRQYRSPEVIIGADWDETADLWSAACMFFELITGDFLFDPRTGENWSRNEDHLALITELISDCPSKDFVLSGKYSKEFYTNAGKLKHIKSLKYWTMQSVLTDKYKWSEEEADEVASFLVPMLAWQPKNRCTAAQALQHFWVKPMPGESDIPDPEKLNVSHSSTEATEASPGNDGNREAATSAPAGAEAGPETLIGLLHATPPPDEKREAPEGAAPETAAPKPPEAAVTAPATIAEECQTTASAAAVVATATPAPAAEPEPSQLPEPTEGDTTQDCSHGGAEVTEASAPASKEVVAPASKEVQVAKAAVCEGASLDDFVDLNSLDLSDCMPLVAALEPSDCSELTRLSLEAGCECKRLDSRHVIVLIRAGTSSAVVSAAQLARKARGVIDWMSLEDYQATLPTDADVEGGDDKPKKKKNNKKNKGKK